MGEAEEERRDSPRIPVELSIEYRHLGRPHEDHSDIARNVSSGGIFVETSVALEVGTEVDVEIGLNQSPHSIRLRAEVVRVEADIPMTGSRSTTYTRGMALRFVDPDPKEVDRLVQISEELEKADFGTDVPIN